MKWLRRLRHALGRPAAAPYSAARHVYAATRAYWCVQAFYIVNLLFAYQTMYTLMDDYGGGGPRPFMEPLWPVWFITPMTLAKWANLLAIAYMLAAVWVAAFPHQRAARIAVFVAMLMAVSLKYSFGSVSHKEHMWIWSALALIFLPSRRPEEMISSHSDRQRYLNVFSGLQGLVLLFYSLTGAWKVVYGAGSLATGYGAGIFAPASLATITANRMIANHQETLLGPWLLDHPVAGMPIFLFVTYLECIAFVVWFRPALHKAWAIAMTLFHVGTWLLLGIVFYLQGPLLAILFLHSPFAAEKGEGGSIVRQVPLLGWLLSRIDRRYTQYRQ